MISCLESWAVRNDDRDRIVVALACPNVTTQRAASKRALVILVDSNWQRCFVELSDEIIALHLDVVSDLAGRGGVNARMVLNVVGEEHHILDHVVAVRDRKSVHTTDSLQSSEVIAHLRTSLRTRRPKGEKRKALALKPRRAKAKLMGANTV